MFPVCGGSLWREAGAGAGFLWWSRKNRNPLLMKPHRFTRRAALVCTMGACWLPAGAAFSQTTESPRLAPVAEHQAAALQAEKAARTGVERKLDSQLLFAARQAAGEPAVKGMPALKSRVTADAEGCVAVSLAAAPTAELRRGIAALGGTVLYESARWGSVDAKVPPGALATLAARPDVKRVAQASKRVAHVGSVTNAAEPAQRAPLARSTYGVGGAGVKVGVISNSCDFYTGHGAAGRADRDFQKPGGGAEISPAELHGQSSAVPDRGPDHRSRGDGKVHLRGVVRRLHGGPGAIHRGQRL